MVPQRRRPLVPIVAGLAMIGGLAFLASRLFKSEDDATATREFASGGSDGQPKDPLAPHLSQTGEAATAPTRDEIAPPANAPDSQPESNATDRGRIARAHVVQSTGSHASSVPLRLTCDFGAEHAGNSLVVETDGDGIAEFVEAQFGQAFGAIASSATFTLRVDLDLDDVLAKTLTLESLFGSTTEFQLPPLGKIDVTLTKGGRSLVDPAEVTLTRGNVFFGGRDSVQPLRRTAVSGVAHFDSIALGRRFYVVVESGGQTVTSTTPHPGPTIEGETAQLRVDLDDVPYYRFRLLGIDGNPIAKRAVEVHRRMTSPIGPNMIGPSVMLGDTVTTDGEGRGEVRWPEPWEAGAKRILSVHLVSGDDTSETGSVAVDVSKEPSKGANDLGDLRVEPPPLLAAGIVVDPSGQPVAGAHVVAKGKGTARADEDSTAEFDALPGYIGSTATTDAQGRFEMRGEAQGAYVLAAGKDSYSDSDPVTIEAGRTNVTLALRAGGNVVAKVQLPGFLDPRQVKGRLFTVRERAKNVREVGPKRIRTCGSDGSIEFQDVAPGAYSFELEAGPLDPALVVDGIVVIAKETTKDPRLASISLAAKLKEIDVTVVDGAGRPIPQAEARTLTPRGSMAGKIVKDGVCRVVIDARGQTVVASADGFRPAVRDDVRSDVRLSLSGALTVTIRATGSEPLARSPVSLQLSIEPTEETKSSLPRAALVDIGIQSFQSDRMASFRVPFPGKYVVQWLWTKSSANYGMATTIGDPKIIELRDVPDVQTFEIDVPKNALDSPGG